MTVGCELDFNIVTQCYVISGREKEKMKMSNELVLSKDITVITAEINSYKQVAGQAIFEIGRRLKHVKENDLVHGEWEKWCESVVNMPVRQANKFIKIYDEVGIEWSTSTTLGFESLYQIATLPEDERTKPHTIPSTGESKTVDEMTVRELREVKKQLKESEELQKLAEDENEKLIKQLQLEKSKPTEIVTNTIEKIVKVDNTDYESLSQLKESNERLKSMIQTKDRQLNLTEKRLEQEGIEAEEYRKLKSDMKTLQGEQGDLHRQLEASKQVATLVFNISQMVKAELAPVKYSEVFKDAQGSDVIMNTLKEAVDTVDGWVHEIRELMPRKKNGFINASYENIIDAEVVEHE